MATFATWGPPFRPPPRPPQGRGGPPPTRSRGPPARLQMEALEERCLLSASPFYSIDGTGNNLAHPEWGSVGQDLLRVAPAQYGGNGSGSVMAGSNRPSPRLISDVIVTDATDG